MLMGIRKGREIEDMERPRTRQREKEQGRDSGQHQTERRDLLQKVLLGAAAVASASLAFERKARASPTDGEGTTARPLDAPRGLAEGTYWSACAMTCCEP
jgi:hypothetical protein